ncbi:MED19 [Mytilus edulis]|uniref:Mediator of RNA polymerase II transcription subunit 19 n=1 Tax=Mytilus edulis TaxID=6550 RepID=A0A8S3VC82_MYTED|nr:MED19 [Mytilus edulis]
MNEAIRRPEQVSPKSSPRGSRSPAYPRGDSTGTLKTTISLGRVPSVIHSGPFYLVKDTGTGTHNTHSNEASEMTGSNNLMIHYGLEHAYSRFWYIDSPGIQDSSSLRSVAENPPKANKDLQPLSGGALSGFRLHPGPIPEQYRFMSQMPKKKHKPKEEEGREIWSFTRFTR